MQSTKYERVDGDNMSPTNGVSPTSGEQWNSIPFTVSFAQQYMYVAPGSKLHSVRNGMVVNLVAFVLHEKLCDPVLGALLVSLLTSLPKFDASVWDTAWCQVHRASDPVVDVNMYVRWPKQVECLIPLRSCCTSERPRC